MPGTAPGSERLACVCACVGANPGNICQAVCDPGSFRLRGGDGRVRGGHVRAGRLACAGAPCARRLLWRVCACTRVSSVASKAPGGDKWYWGLQRAPQL